MTRRAAFAGSFYPGNPDDLRGMLAELLPRAGGRRERALGVMVPHAGYIYSGRVAGETYAAVEPPRSAVLVGPSHHGGCAPAAVMSSGEWATPLGVSPVDGELAAALRASSGLLTEDPAAHSAEHSLEVQLPFLQAVTPGIPIVPILLSLPDLDSLRELGRAIGGVLKPRDPRPLVVASSDMNHFEPHKETIAKDRYALDALLALDEAAMWGAVRRHRISMCGAMAAVVMLAAAKVMGASRATLVAHTTSGPVSGDMERTVGYAGVVIS